MDKKFMNIKRIILPVMTVIVLTSQLMGCASVSSNEMLEMLEQGESIEIEVAMPSYLEEEQGTETELNWEELGYIDTYRDFRSVFDDTLFIHSAGETGKNGPAYIDLEGNWTNNSTLYYAMMNKVFMEDYWNVSETKDKLLEAVQSAYVDIDTSDTASNKESAVINAYFNIFKDNEPGYANMNSTLTRGEFLGGLVKADTPVDKSLTADEALETLVGNNENNVLASQALENSYLDIATSSLDELTYNGVISKAEAVYSVVHRYFGDELSTVDVKQSAYADTKNAGNIALRAGYAEKDETGNINYKPKYKSYVIASMVQNPEKGIDEEIYKAMVIAKQYNLISGTESAWDEAITKGEAIQLIMNTYKGIVVRDGYITDAQDGLSEGQVVDRETGSSSESEASGTIEYKDGLSIESSGSGEDTKADEEIQAELAEVENEQADPSTSVDGKYDGGGINLETGEYNADYDTNNGQGWDINGVHYENWGDYLEAGEKLTQELFGDDIMTTEELKAGWWTPDQGPLTE